MKKTYGAIQVTSNHKKYEIKGGGDLGREYIERTYIIPYGRGLKGQGNTQTEIIYIDDFVTPSAEFNNDYLGQHNTTATSGYLINITDNYEAVLYNFCPIPHRPFGLKVKHQREAK